MRWKIAIGLGNPGEEFRDTYHNAGLAAADFLAKESSFKKHGNFEYAKVGCLIIVKSLTYMNESGLAVKEALSFFKKEAADVLIMHDDSDIVLGRYKISCGRGSAGHNGVKSVIEKMGTDEFCRLRLGIRSSSSKAKAGSIVLKKMRKADMAVLKTSIREAFQETESH
ncbi:MAG: aminoacyl-tRNA hydrolase [Patescibacteria group bacterium]|nr:aminoacyl-tRNA hydrolase [Patescibacteria group bacterium]